MSAALDAIAERVGGLGLLVFSHCAAEPGDGLPADARTIVLVGNAGPAMWRRFAVERRDEADPLDAWTRRSLDPAAESLAETADVVGVSYPFAGPPYYPFQQWATRSGIAFPSPIGPLIHPRYGLLHAYRAAFLVGEEIALPAAPYQSPCETCRDQPCLSACPVNAFSTAGYDIAVCAGHLATAAGEDCMTQSCRARRACPVGADYSYGESQARFHMDRFLAARRPA